MNIFILATWTCGEQHLKSWVWIGSIISKWCQYKQYHLVL